MRSELTAVTASCAGCNWSADSLNALGLAARHYDATGHPVTTTVTRAVHYGNAGDLDRVRQDAGQFTIEGAL